MKKYKTYFDRWLNWSSKYEEIEPLPASKNHFILFLVSLIQSGESFNVIESCYYAVKHFHKIASEPDPTCNTLTEYILDAAKRINAKPKKKKQPITADHIRKIYDYINEEGMNLLHRRNLTMILLCFAGFLRYEEVSKLTLGDLEICENYCKLFIEKSKTDQLREGTWVLIAKTNSEICPLEALKSYITSANLISTDEYLFRSMTYFKSIKQHRLRKKNSPLSYSTARSTILAYLKKIGLDEKLFGLHSLRRGGATAAANSGINDRLFQKHGRWKSVNAKDGYVDEDLNNLLSVSLGLGL